MPRKPLVSVITSCFNHAPYLEQYFSGLLEQSYPDMELILLDDGSTDRSWPIIEDYRPFLIQKFHRLICLRNENQGYRRQIQKGMSLAEGDLICFLDSDDYFYPEKVEKCVAYLESHPEAGVVHSDLDFIYPDKIIRSHWKQIFQSIPTGDIFERLLTDFYILPSASCIRAPLIGLFVDFNSYERYPMTDLPLFLDLALHTEFGFIDEALTAYRVSQGSMARPSDSREHLDFHRSIYQVRCEYADRREISEPVRRQVWRNYFSELYRKGYEWCFYDECMEGYRWLAEKYPEEFDSRWHRLNAYSTKHPLVWKTLRYARTKKLSHLMRGRS